MCCILAALFAFGPRAAILVWWLVDQVRWNQAFDTFLWPLAGFLVAPWTTLMYVAVFPAGIDGFDWIGSGMRGRVRPVLVVGRRLHRPEPLLDLPGLRSATRR